MLKYFLLFVSIILSTSLLYGQEKENLTYKVVNSGKVSDITPYISAMNNADFKCHRMLSKPRKITFDTDVEINLESALDIASKGISVDKNCLTDEAMLPETEPIYTLHESGIIIELHESTMKTKK